MCHHALMTPEDMLISRLQVATVFVNDIEGALPFYTKKLGFSLVADWRGDDGDRMVFLKPGDAETEIGLYAPGEGDPRIGVSTGLVFTSPDIRASVEALKRRGVTFTRDIIVHDYGEGDRPEDEGDLEAEFEDVDGNRFLLHS